MALSSVFWSAALFFSISAHCARGTTQFPTYEYIGGFSLTPWANAGAASAAVTANAHTTSSTLPTCLFMIVLFAKVPRIWLSLSWVTQSVHGLEAQGCGFLCRISQPNKTWKQGNKAAGPSWCRFSSPAEGCFRCAILEVYAGCVPGEDFLPRNLRLPDERPRLRKGHWHAGLAGIPSSPDGRRSRPGALQHLLNPR